MTTARSGGLNDTQMTYVVTRLAADGAPAEIAQGLKTMFGIDITPRAVARYHPATAGRKKLSKPLQALFWEIRKNHFLTNDDILGMDLKMRLALRQRVFFEAWAAGQLGIANEILDAISAECNAYEREFGHEPSGPSPLRTH